ncbi:MAG: hypothetical protein WAM60_21865 [Candidatus Promineifilaceae bacterium]
MTSTIEPTLFVPTATLTPDNAAVSPTAVISSGPVILFARSDDLWIMTVDDSSLHRLIEGEMLDWGMEREGDSWLRISQSRPVRVSPDGRWAAFSQTGLNMVFVDVTMAEPPRFTGPDGSIPDWSPNSQYLAHGVHRLVIYDMLTAQREVLVSGYGGGISNLVWSPDNRFIAFACCFQETGNEQGVQVGEIQRVEVASGQVETIGETTLSIGGGVPPLCWTADDQIVTQQTNHVRCSYYRGESALSPDGQWTAVLSIASSGDDPLPSEPNLLSVQEANSDTVVWQRPLEMAVSRVLWSPDGDYLLIDDDQPDSPIWRIKADGTSEIEVVIEAGYLLDAFRIAGKT